MLKPVVLDQGDGLLLFKLFVDAYAQGFADRFAFFLKSNFVFNVCGPIIDVVCCNTIDFFGSLNEPSEVVIIGSFLKLEAFSVVDKLRQLIRKSFAEDFSRRGHFFL